MRERSVRSSGASGSSCACPGASAKPMARPAASAITQALVPKPPRERPSASRSSRRAELPPFCGLVVGTDAGAVEKGHPQLDAAPLLRQFQQAFPDAVAVPAPEGLLAHPPRPQFRRDVPPGRPFLVPPDDGRDGPAQVVMLGLVRRTAPLDQRRQLVPLLVRQDPVLGSTAHPIDMGQNSGTDRP